MVKGIFPENSAIINEPKRAPTKAFGPIIAKFMGVLFYYSSHAYISTLPYFKELHWNQA